MLQAIIEINNRTETAYQLITVYFYVGYIIANLQAPSYSMAGQGFSDEREHF